MPRSDAHDPALPADAARGAPSASALIDRVFARASGAPLVHGNDVCLLRDARENYPAWLDAIARAERTIHFECYILHEDEIGREFADALAARARAGVRVRVLYDWLGALARTSSRFWRELAAGRVEVRCFNPPRLGRPLAWLSRDHRKTLVIDGRVGFVTGLCVGRPWVGDPRRGVEPWRDTGVGVRGPAVADLERAFARMWALAGPEMREAEVAVPPAAGRMPARVIASEPGTAGLYRLDQVMAAAARHTLWLTDAYFVGTTPYVQSLCAAARDGVDVRLLVPGATDIWLLRNLSRSGYRPLLEGGVRVFEWNGPMLHAKTAVVDGRWARVGSTNLNVQSWLGNWEMDVAVEDAEFGGRMQAMYAQDLERATEIVLTSRARVVRAAPAPRRTGRRSGSVGRATAGAISVGSAVGAAMTARRPLGPAEAKIMTTGAVALMVLAAIALFWPRVVTVPIAAVAVWASLALGVRAWRLRRERAAPSDAADAAPDAGPSQGP